MVVGGTCGQKLASSNTKPSEVLKTHITRKMSTKLTKKRRCAIANEKPRHNAIGMVAIILIGAIGFDFSKLITDLNPSIIIEVKTIKRDICNNAGDLNHEPIDLTISL